MPFTVPKEIIYILADDTVGVLVRPNEICCFNVFLMEIQKDLQQFNKTRGLLIPYVTFYVFVVLL